MVAVFRQGDARVVLRRLPADFFHCVVTSPPYFGLRKYEGGEEIWDGDGECVHEWGAEIVRRDRGSAKGASAVVGNQIREVSGVETKQGNFCRLCGSWRGQLGGEPTPDLFIQHLVEIFRETKRVLRPDGVFWLNCGDSWAGYWGDKYAHRPFGKDRSPGPSTPPNKPSLDFRRGSGVKPLDMVLIPSLLALALRTDGWYVRSVVIWRKLNPMPESVNGWRWEKHRIKIKNNGRGEEASRNTTAGRPQQDHDGKDFKADSEWQECMGCSKCSPDEGYVLRKGSWRPTDAHEYVLMLTKTNHYYCDREAVLEPIADSTVGRGKVDFGGAKGRAYNPSKDDPNFRNGSEQWGRTYDYTESNSNGGRNLRSVWSFPTKPGKFNHYAAYPPRLPEICIKSSTSEKGCCPRCGSPWARVIEKGLTAHDGTTDTAYPVGSNANRISLMRQAARERGGEYANSSQTVDWRPTCSCNAGNPVPCRVLDPFSGAGTTALVADQLGLSSISVDTSAEYIALSKERLADARQKRSAELIKQVKRLDEKAKKEVVRISRDRTI